MSHLASQHHTQYYRFCFFNVLYTYRIHEVRKFSLFYTTDITFDIAVDILDAIYIYAILYITLFLWKVFCLCFCLVVCVLNLFRDHMRDIRKLYVCRHRKTNAMHWNFLDLKSRRMKIATFSSLHHESQRLIYIMYTPAFRLYWFRFVCASATKINREMKMFVMCVFVFGRAEIHQNWKCMWCDLTVWDVYWCLNRTLHGIYRV